MPRQDVQFNSNVHIIKGKTILVIMSSPIHFCKNIHKLNDNHFQWKWGSVVISHLMYLSSFTGWHWTLTPPFFFFFSVPNCISLAHHFGGVGVGGGGGGIFAYVTVFLKEVVTFCFRGITPFKAESRIKLLLMKMSSFLHEESDNKLKANRFFSFFYLELPQNAAARLCLRLYASVAGRE